MKLLAKKWWVYPLILFVIYLIAFPFFFRNPDHLLFFEVYSRFNGTLEHIAIDEKKELLVQNFESVEIGALATDFTLTDVDGNTSSLSDFKGKTVLLTFWASWCPTCRAENKHLVEVYPQFKDQGFEIFAVSLDRSKKNWEKAIEKDGITWTQVSDLEGVDSPIATQYGVYSTPTTFLINEEGVIVAKDVQGEALEKELAEILEGS